MATIYERKKVLEYGVGETLEVFYSEIGSGSKIVLCLHDLWGSKKSYEELLFPHIPKRKWRFLALDWPGHHYAPALSGGTIFKYAEVLYMFILQMGVWPLYVIGESAGGTAAMLCAAEHPELFRALMVQGALDSGKELLGMMDHTVREHIFRTIRHRRGMARGILQSQFESLKNKATFDLNTLWHLTDVANSIEIEMLKAAYGLRALARENIKSADVHAVFEILLSLFEIELGDKLKNFQVPVLVLDGASPSRPELVSAHRIMDALPRGVGELCLFPWVGHLLMYFFPLEVLEMSLEFFSRPEIRWPIWRKIKSFRQ